MNFKNKAYYIVIFLQIDENHRNLILSDDTNLKS